MAEKVTAGRDRMGEFAPKFAELNDDVLFGQVWSRTDQLSLHDRSMVTIAALMSGGNFPQLESHLNLAKQNGVTQKEVTETFTQLAFYCGWPKAWTALNLAKAIYADDSSTEVD